MSKILIFAIVGAVAGAIFYYFAHRNLTSNLPGQGTMVPGTPSATGIPIAPV